MSERGRERKTYSAVDSTAHGGRTDQREGRWEGGKYLVRDNEEIVGGGILEKFR